MSAARKRGGRRAPRRQIFALAAALLAIVAASGVPSTSTAAVATIEQAAIELVAAPSAGGTVLEGQPLTVRVTLSNAGSRATGSLRVELRLDAARAAPLTELTAWFDRDPVPNEPSLDDNAVTATTTIDALGAGDSAVLDLVVPAQSALWGGSFGARLAEVAVAEGADWVAVDRTAVVRVPNGTTPPTVAATFVQPLTTPGDSSGLLSPEVLEAATAEAGALTRVLSVSVGRPVLLAIDPRVVVSIRALGDAAPESAIAFLERLIAAPNDSFLLPWADADPVAPLDAAQVSLPRREGTGRVMTDAPPDAPQATTEPAAEPDDSTDGPGAIVTTVPVDSLIDVVPTLNGVLWPGIAGFSASALDALVADGARVVVTPSSILESDNAVQRYGEAVLLRADEALSAAAQSAAAASSAQQFDRALARVSAVLATVAIADPSTTAVIPLSRETVQGGDRLLELLDQTASLPWTTTAPIATAASGATTTAVLTEPVGDESRAAAVVAALDAEAADREFAQIALTPALITDPRRLELLAALSLGWGDSGADALRGFVAESVLLRSSVRVVESSAILLLTDRATLPVTVQNDLEVAVRVFVRVDPDTAQLRVLNENVEAIVEPQSQVRTLVPVESLTNGEVDITVTVQDAQGRALSEPTRVALSLQAGWETAGTITVALAVAGLFIAGIARDLRRRRRRKAEAGETPAPGKHGGLAP